MSLGSKAGPARNPLGFSLLEVVIAIALFGMAVGALGSAYLNTISAVDRVQLDHALEQDLALVRQVALLKESVEELEEGGEIETGSHGLAIWSAEYEYTGVADLFKVSLFIELEGAEGEGEEEEEERKVEQTLYLTRPTWSDPTERGALREETRQRFLEQQIGLRE